MEENIWENETRNNGTDPEALEVVTLEDVIFMKMKNDLSFIVGSSLNLYEHQSSWNPNNGALMEKCRRLWEYSEFSSEIEENIRSGMNRKEAVETAMDTCIEKGILRDVLIREKAEVMHMLLTEYDEKKHLRNTYREGKEEGREEGLREGLVLKLREQIQKKLTRGKNAAEIAEELEEDIQVIEGLISSQKTEQ